MPGPLSLPLLEGVFGKECGCTQFRILISCRQLFPIGSFSLEIAVASDYIAVSNGKLLYQVSKAAAEVGGY
jgi:hypothetical protein